MKYAMIIPDGMGDFPVTELKGKTPVEVAFTPFLDKISSSGRHGLCRTVPEGFYPGSDVCILSLLGYDPSIYYSGRAPLEAASLGIPVENEDLVMRCNLIHIGDKGEIIDHCAGHITTDEAKEILKTLSKELGNDFLHFYPGVSYRHIAVWKNKRDFEARTTPPHDVPGELFEKHLPEGKDAQVLKDLILRSQSILKDHPVNQKRKSQGKLTANSIWLWGTGYKPKIETFKEKFGVKGAVISAVDLIKGLAVLMDLKEMKVPGITGYFDTDYKAKGEYALKALKDHDLIIVHVEAPDEAGHVGNLAEKIKAIEMIDRHILGPVLEYLESMGDYRIWVTPDHYTPVEKRIHVNHPVPFALSGKGVAPSGFNFSEKNAEAAAFSFGKGYELMPYFLNQKVIP